MVIALDMQSGKIAWQCRQRAPCTMGVLTTAGGVLFTGSIDASLSLTIRGQEESCGGRE
jgi:hypothetical protein